MSIRRTPLYLETWREAANGHWLFGQCWRVRRFVRKRTDLDCVQWGMRGAVVAGVGEVAAECQNLDKTQAVTFASGRRSKHSH